MKVHLFNPTCEMEVANGVASYTPPAYLQQMAKDLEVLPALYASQDDMVLVCRLPEKSLLDRWHKAGFYFRNFCLISEQNSQSTYEPQPWGWSPAVARKLKPWGAEWNPALLPFFHRSFALKILRLLMEKKLSNILPFDDLPLATKAMSDVENLLTERGKLVIKAPLSSAGRGVQILRNEQLNVSIFNKTRSIIRQQGAVMLESLLDKQSDFAYEFYITKGQISFVGYSSFDVNDKGQYDYHRFPFLSSYFSEAGRVLWDCGTINAVKDELLNVLQDSGICDFYSGYLGVDAMIYKAETGEMRLQPCVEINLRYNMGIVALFLESHLEQGSSGIFNIVPKQDVNFSIFDLEMQSKYPLVVNDGHIISGYLPLTPPQEEAQSLAYILVSC